MTTQATSVLNCACIVGESLIWDASRQRLLWVDMLGHKIHAFDPVTGAHQTWPTPGMVTSIGLRKDGGAIVGLQKIVALWDFGDDFEPLVTVELDLPNNRLNEGVVGPDGCLWVGTMANNVDENGASKEQSGKTGSLYRVTPGGEVLRLSNDLYGLPNTFAWVDGSVVVGDSLENTLYRYTLDGSGETLSERQVFFGPYERGLPDGSCTDATGSLWNCRVVGGHAVAQLSPNGAVESLAETQCSWPTSCTFGGADLDTLYITSARFTMDDDHLASSPWEGDLFACKPGVQGVPCNLFG